jgi:hypothetical protein
MLGPDPAPWFVGDLADAWISGIAAALPAGAVRIDCPGGLPRTWPEGLAPARTLILHRAILTNADFEILRRLRQSPGSPKLVLCVGPHARYHALERWAGLVDAIVPEATARDSLARHLAGAERRSRPTGPSPRVAVVSGLFDLRQVLAAACQAAGYPVKVAADETDFAEIELAVWDVPLLDPQWPRILSRVARRRTLVTVLGFADRATVDIARRAGSSACLEWPCDPEDLAFVLDRLSGRWHPSEALGSTTPPRPNFTRARSRGRIGHPARGLG